MSRSAGFSLIEVIIALTLIAFIMLGLVGALRAFGDSSARLDTRAHQLDELRLVPRFLAQVVPTSSARARGPATGGAPTWFSGSERELEFLGIMPARHGPGGMSHFRISLQPSSSGQALTISILPYVVGQTDPPWERALTEVLVDDVTALEIDYRAARSDSWESQWQGRTQLPGWVRLSLRTDHGAWPPLIFRLPEARFGDG